jgi:hypothetical protein
MWVAGAGLTRDGLAVSVARLRGDGGGGGSKECERLDAAAELAEPLAGGGHGGPAGEAWSPARYEKAAKKKKREKRGSPAQKGAKEAMEPRPGAKPPAGTAGMAVVEWQPTRSGLLSPGARETGVKVGRDPLTHLPSL